MPCKYALRLFDSNGAFFANLNATVAAETLFGIDGYGFRVLQFKHFNRTHIHTFSAAYAFFFVHNGIKSHSDTPPFIGYLHAVELFNLISDTDQTAYIN
jgi:hypothetical protein